MKREPFEALRSRAAVLLRDDVDTDQIIPARFLTTTERTGLGRHLFADWRFDPSGAPRPEFALNSGMPAGARILIAGRNFGCGSSREHAAWALHDHGFCAIVARSFGDIFRSNAHKNGLLTITVDAAAHGALVQLARDLRDVEIHLPGQRVSVGDTFAERFDIDPFVKECLSQGIDELDFLLTADPEITAWERGTPALAPTHDEALSTPGARPA